MQWVRTHERLGMVFKEKFLREKEKIKPFFNIIHLLLRRINFFTMSRIKLSTSMPQNVRRSERSLICFQKRATWSWGRSICLKSRRLVEDDSGRTNERRSLPAWKEPRSITLLHERRKSIDLGTEAAARRERERRNRRWIRSLRHRARVSPRHASHIGESIFSKVRPRSAGVVWGSVSYLAALYKYNNILW